MGVALIQNKQLIKFMINFFSNTSELILAAGKFLNLAAGELLNAYFPIIIMTYFVSVLSYMVATWSAQQQLVPKLSANLLRLASLVILTLVMTLVFLKHGVEIFAPSVNCTREFAIFSVANWLYLWTKDFDVRYALATLVLGSLLALVIYGLGFNNVYTNGPSWINLFCLQGIALWYVQFFCRDFHDFGWVHRRLLYWDFYKTQMDLLKRDLHGSCLSLMCSVSIGLLNTPSLAQNCQGWMGAAGLLLCSGLLAYNTMISVGLIALCHNTQPVVYHWGFVIQTYINLWLAFKAVCQQTYYGLLPRLAVARFGFVLTLVGCVGAVVAIICTGSSGGPGQIENTNLRAEIAEINASLKVVQDQIDALKTQRDQEQSITDQKLNKLDEICTIITTKVAALEKVEELKSLSATSQLASLNLNPLTQADQVGPSTTVEEKSAPMVKAEQVEPSTTTVEEAASSDLASK